MVPLIVSHLIVVSLVVVMIAHKLVRVLRLTTMCSR